MLPGVGTTNLTHGCFVSFQYISCRFTQYTDIYKNKIKKKNKGWKPGLGNDMMAKYFGTDDKWVVRWGLTIPSTNWNNNRNYLAF